MRTLKSPPCFTASGDDTVMYGRPLKAPRMHFKRGIRLDLMGELLRDHTSPGRPFDDPEESTVEYQPPTQAHPLEEQFHINGLRSVIK